MIFNFLRLYLKDDEFERNKVDLLETRAVLQEYKIIIQEQSNIQREEKEKVDPDFLVLIWGSVGFAFGVFGLAGQKLIELQSEMQFPFFVWAIIAIFTFFFIFENSLFALDLTRQYAASKSNPEYIKYARYLIWGAIILVAGVIGIAFFE